MSSQPDQAAVQAASDVVASNYVMIGAFALVAYDTLLTFPHEVEYMWLKKIKLGTILYLLARYTMLVVSVLNMFLEFSAISLQACNAVIYSMDAIYPLPLIGIQGLLLARTYALSDQKRLVLAVFVVLGCCAVVPLLAQTAFDNCHQSQSESDTAGKLTIVGGIGVMLFDTVVAAVTLSRTLGTWRLHERSTWRRMSFINLLAQQSLIRYGFVLTISLTNLIITMTLRPSMRNFFASMQNSLSVILICRLHLELQRSVNRSSARTTWNLTTPPVGVSHTTTQRMHDAVVAEFGDWDSDELGGPEMSEGGVVVPENPARATGNNVSLVESQSRQPNAEITLEV